tara:strand:+ start:193 stop:1203 length:1011 start_codon:yes stop_codon:yes gene_type:complete
MYKFWEFIIILCIKYIPKKYCGKNIYLFKNNKLGLCPDNYSPNMPYDWIFPDYKYYNKYCNEKGLCNFCINLRNNSYLNKYEWIDTKWGFNFKKKFLNIYEVGNQVNIGLKNEIYYMMDPLIPSFNINDKNIHILKSGKLARCPESYTTYIPSKYRHNGNKYYKNYCNTDGLCNLCFSTKYNARFLTENEWAKTKWNKKFYGYPIDKTLIGGQFSISRLYMVDPLVPNYDPFNNNIYVFKNNNKFMGECLPNYKPYMEDHWRVIINKYYKKHCNPNGLCNICICSYMNETKCTEHLLNYNRKKNNVLLGKPLMYNKYYINIRGGLRIINALNLDMN